MKKLLSISLITFLLGTVIGHQLSREHKIVAATNQPPMEATVETQQQHETTTSDTKINDQLVSRLKKDNEELSLALQVAQNEIFGAEDYNHLKKQWIKDILQTPEERQNTRIQKNIQRLAKRLNLTPDQFIQLEMFTNLQSQKQRLRSLKELGIIDSENGEYDHIKNFNFDEALKGILTEEQVASYDKQTQNRLEQKREFMAGMVSQKYKFTNADIYSANEQKAITQVLKTAITNSNEIQVPEAIQQLKLNKEEKRILAIGYENMEPELFEKVYESIINNRQRGGRRGGSNRNNRPNP